MTGVQTCALPIYNLAASLDEAKTGIKNLFAQSYDTWQWDGSAYISATGDWGPPEDLCDGATRETSSSDYCVYTPKVENIKINSSAENISVSNNGFINLTFTSDVDNQQQPMVLYAVDWGDNEDTVVTGVEMHDKPNADNPHVLYHLYNYWDLKAKNLTDQGTDENSIYCGSADSSTATNIDGVTIDLGVTQIMIFA